MSPIIRKDNPCWSPTCDSCGEGDNYEYGGSFHYSSEAEAIDAVKIDWHHTSGGAWLCISCCDQSLEVACPKCSVEKDVPCTFGMCAERIDRWFESQK